MNSFHRSFHNKLDRWLCTYTMYWRVASPKLKLRSDNAVTYFLIVDIEMTKMYHSDDRTE